MNNVMHEEHTPYNHFGSNNYADTSSSLMELSLNLRSQLNSLKSVKKNITRRFESPAGSNSKASAEKLMNFEQKYYDMKAKNEELEESHRKVIDETLIELRENRQSYERKIRSLEDELVQKDTYIEVMKKGHLHAQEKVHILEARITSLEQLNATLTLQLKDKMKELAESVDGVNNSVSLKGRDLASMNTEFTQVMDRVGRLEDVIRNLRESKKEDGKTLEDLNTRYDDQKTENFSLLMENKKLKNTIDELETKLASFDKSSLERRQQTDEFLRTLEGYQSSLQAMNKVHLNLDTVCGPLKEQNRRLMEDKERLIEENKTLKKAVNELQDSQKKVNAEAMDVEGKEPTNDEKNDVQEKEKINGEVKVDQKFYMDVMEKFKEFEKQIETKERDNENMQTELCELKAKNLELETKIISMNRSPRHKSATSDQFLTMDYEPQSAASPRRKNNTRKNSTEASENKRNGENDEEAKETEQEGLKVIKEGNEDEYENEPRLKITRKPKPVAAKKNTSGFNFLTGIQICPNCSLIIKKSDKNIKDCTKCHTSLHDKCIGDHAEDNVMCQNCIAKAKKESQNMDEEVDEEEASKNS